MTAEAVEPLEQWLQNYLELASDIGRGIRVETFAGGSRLVRFIDDVPPGTVVYLQREEEW